MNLPLLALQLPWLAVASLRLALVLGAFLLVRPLLRHFVGSGWLSILWLLLLVRILVPWPLSTPLGLQERVAGMQANTAGNFSAYEVRARVIEGGEIHSPAGMNTIPVTRAFRWREVWLAGFAMGLATLGVRSLRTLRLARKTDPARDERLLAIFAEIPDAWRRGVDLRETDVLSVPTLAGLLRPAIWMPRAWLVQLSDAELRHVLLHELGHARRRDLCVQWLFSLAVCLHWFNPLVWLAARCARADREMACDAWVLARSQDTAPDAYGATLLKTIALLREPLRLAPHAVAMAASKRGLFTRVATLGNFRARPAWRGVAGLFVLGAALVVLTTTRLGAQAPTTTPAPTAPPAAGVAPTPVSAAARQIEIAARFVEITDSAAKELAAADSLLATLIDGKAPPVGRVVGLLTTDRFDAVLRAIGEPKGVDLLSAPRVTTRSGQRAVIEIIREFRYPTEFDPGDGKTPITPTAFETRNLGVTLEVEPTLGPDGKTIDLNLVPQVVELTGFNRVGPGGSSSVVKVPAGKFADVKAGPGETLQPIFSTRKITTNVTIFDGQTIVLGGLRKDGDIDEKGQPLEARQLVVFITAKTVEEAAPPAPTVIIESKFTEHSATGTSVLASPKVETQLGQRAIVRMGDEKHPMLDATFLAQRGGDGRIEIDTTLTKTDAAGAKNLIDIPKLKLKPGQPASVRIADYEVSLTVTLPGAPAGGDAATATPVPDKPGFVTSPYAPAAGYIDVRGIPPGTVVRCPYSGKMFLVP